MFQFYTNKNKHQAKKNIESFKNGTLKKGKSFFAIELDNLIKNLDLSKQDHSPKESDLLKYGFKELKVIKYSFGTEEKSAFYLYENKERGLFLMGKTKCGSDYAVFKAKDFNLIKNKYNSILSNYKEYSEKYKFISID